jgi:hypothetical protein
LIVTTTAPARASRVPSYTAAHEAPTVNEPPCTNTITGRPEPVVSGVRTSAVRYSAPGTHPGPTIGVMSGVPGVSVGPCGAVGPGAVASRSPSHDTGAGRAKRRSPTGAAA